MTGRHFAAGAAALPVTADMVADALGAISPNLDRETWVRLAMAVKAELGADGFTVWDAWSQAADNYKADDARATWRSIKAGGKVTVATLFGIAKDHGWKRPTSPRAPRRTPAEIAADAERKRQQQATDAAEELRQHQESARRSEVLWNKATASPPAGGVPYLQRKGVGAHGLRFLLGGVALVPMRDAAGHLWSVQRLLAKKLRDPESGKDTTDKLYGPPKAERGEKMASRKSGLFHVLGVLEAPPLVLLAEGYATGATLHEATGQPVVVCFDAGNLVHVVEVLHAQLPGASLLVCGDDDTGTAVRIGKNPGRIKAEAAAQAWRAGGGAAAAVFPAGLAEGESDFNDLAASAGLDAVRQQVEAAAQLLVLPAVAADAQAPAGGGHEVTPAEPSRHGAPALRLVAGVAIDARGRGHPGDDVAEGDGRPEPPEPADAGGRRGRGGKRGAGGGGAGGDDVPPDWDPFTVTDAGVWHTARDGEGNSKKPQWLCSRLDVTARTRADDANGWGALLEFADPDGNRKAWAMPSAMLSGDGSEWAGRLRDMGLTMAPGTPARNLVARYIDTRKPADRVICTDRVGWHGSVYVLPSSSIASTAVQAEGRRYVFQSDAGMEDTFRQQGTLADWQARVGALCVGNSRLGFAVSCAFAAPMMRLAEVESGGVHFRGISSQGKTTALRVAASVFGGPSYMQRWRTTDNALEATAVQHCDAPLILDEFGQLDPKVAGDVAYMLANDAEKSRGTRSGLLRKRRTWRLLFLSSGEITLSQHMEAAGKTARAGQEVRMLDVPLDAGAGMGGLEVLHGFERPAMLADAIVSAASRSYGTAGRAWLEWSCENFDALPGRLVPMMERYRDEMVPEAAAEQVRRAGTRFGLVAAAGELATEAGVTGWPAGQAAWAARACFNAWLAARGHLNNGEEEAMVRQVRGFLELHAEGRFTWSHRAMDDHSPKTLNRAGFRRMLGEDGKPIRTHSDHQQEFGERMTAAAGERAQADYLILREVFERDVCQGFDPRAVAEELRRRGHLEHEAGRLTERQRLPGMSKVPVYHVRASVFDDAG